MHCPQQAAASMPRLPPCCSRRTRRHLNDRVNVVNRSRTGTRQSTVHSSSNQAAPVISMMASKLRLRNLLSSPNWWQEGWRRQVPCITRKSHTKWPAVGRWSFYFAPVSLCNCPTLPLCSNPALVAYRLLQALDQAVGICQAHGRPPARDRR